MLMDPQPSQQHVGLDHALWQRQVEVVRPKARLIKYVSPLYYANLSVKLIDKTDKFKWE